MTYYVYQIGDTPLFHSMKGVNGTPLSMDVKTKWSNPTTKLSDVGGEVTFLPATRSIKETPKISIKGIASASPTMPLRFFIERLKNMGGRRDVPIIVFRAEASDCGDCGDCFSMDWLLGFATFTDIPIKTEVNSDNPFTWETADVSMSGVLTTDFMRLPPWFWQYMNGQDKMFDPSLKPIDIDFPIYTFFHPTDISQFLPDGYFFKWSSADSDFDPIFWGLKYSEITGGQGSDFIEFGRVSLYSNPMEWSTIASGLYAFTGLGSTGTIEIEVTKRTGFFEDDVIIETSTLDLAQLSTDLAAFGYGELAESDVIFTGVAEPLPGYILRDGEAISEVRPKWSYPGLYPGEPGYDFSSIRLNKIDTQGLVAYLFEFGVH